MAKSRIKPKRYKPIPKAKGFAKPKPPDPSQHKKYLIELRRRYLSDDSEALLGTAALLVPKIINDPCDRCYKREVWDAFAMMAGYALLISKECEAKGVNQVFVFDTKYHLVHRCETNAWEESSGASHTEEFVDNDFNLIALAVEQCYLDIHWLEVPQVA